MKILRDHFVDFNEALWRPCHRLVDLESNRGFATLRRELLEAP